MKIVSSYEHRSSYEVHMNILVHRYARTIILLFSDLCQMLFLKWWVVINLNLNWRGDQLKRRTYPPSAPPPLPLNQKSFKNNCDPLLSATHWHLLENISEWKQRSVIDLRPKCLVRNSKWQPLRFHPQENLPKVKIMIPLMIGGFKLFAIMAPVSVVSGQWSRTWKLQQPVWKNKLAE